MDAPGGVVHEVELAEMFADIARQIQHRDTPEETWQAIADLAVTLGFEHCGISIVRSSRRIDTPVASDDLPGRVDAVQYETDQGPCLDAIREADTYRTDDLAAESRWPQFAARTVAETGVRSMLALRLFTDTDESLGALNFYSRQLGTFDDRAKAVGGVLAAHAAVAMSAVGDHGTVGQLQDALVGSRVISTAVGILMVQTGSSRDAAFRLLTQASMRSNVKLRAIAEQIVIGQEQQLRR